MRFVMRTALVLLTAAIFMAPASSHAFMYVVCTKYSTSDNCTKCSQYFSANSESEAESECSKKGYSSANTFRTLGAVSAFKMPTCDCKVDD